MSVDDIVNTGLLFNPYNWIIVVLILAVSSMALCLLFGGSGVSGLSQVV